MKKNFGHFKIYIPFPSTRASTVTIRFLQKTMTAIPQCAQTTVSWFASCPIRASALVVEKEENPPSLMSEMDQVWSLAVSTVLFAFCTTNNPLLFPPHPSPPPKKKPNNSSQLQSKSLFSPYLLSKSQRKTYFCCKGLKTCKFHS